MNPGCRAAVLMDADYGRDAKLRTNITALKGIAPATVELGKEALPTLSH
jgi:hypothetical protein